MILNIEGAMEHSCLENCSGAKYKIFPVIFLIFNNNIPLRWLSTSSSTGNFDYSYAYYMYSLQIEYFIIGIRHGCFCHFFVKHVFWVLLYRYTLLSGTFHFLTEPGIFPCTIYFRQIQGNKESKVRSWMTFFDDVNNKYKRGKLSPSMFILPGIHSGSQLAGEYCSIYLANISRAAVSPWKVVENMRNHLSSFWLFFIHERRGT